jgi:membrane-associated phospholipid phosphatase
LTPWRGRLAGRAAGLVAAGAVVLCGLAAVVAYVFDSVLEGDGIAAVDQPTVAWLAEHRRPVLTTVMRTISTIGSPLSAAAVAMVICALVAWRIRSWLPAVVAVLGMAGFGLTDTVVKLVVHRQRPPLAYSAVAAHGYSFPSGHAMGIATSALISAWALCHWIFRSTSSRIATWMGAITITVAVGFSRVYLGVHYPSDVIAGWALGAIWASVVISFAGLSEQSSRIRSAAALR